MPLTARSKSKGKTRDTRCAYPDTDEHGDLLAPVTGERTRHREHQPSAALAQLLAARLAPVRTEADSGSSTVGPGIPRAAIGPGDAEDNLAFDTAGSSNSSPQKPAPAAPPPRPTKRKQTASADRKDTRALIKFLAWHALIYRAMSFLEPSFSSSSTFPAVNSMCTADCLHTQSKCPSKKQPISVFYLNKMALQLFDSCQCRGILNASLIKAHLFPASPTQARAAFHFDVLRLYSTSRDWSDNNAMSFANTLIHHWDLLSPTDGLRRQLTSASMWFLVAGRYKEDKEIDGGRPWTASRPHHTVDHLRLSLDDLIRRCPACFLPFVAGPPEADAPAPLNPALEPQLIVSIDGNFTHCRQMQPDHVQRNASPPTYFLSQDQVQRTAQEMARLGRKHVVGAMADTINACTANVKAADELAAKGAYGVCDITGLVGLCCRHDIPLIFCDITSPGERHCYAIALLRALITAVPALQHIGVLYDIGCRFGNKRNISELLPVTITWAVSSFHVYGHNYRCQVLHSPRRRHGFGWSDGEGMERVWSALSDLISAERTMSHGERHAALETRLRHIGYRHLMELHDNIKKKKKRIQQAASKARSVLRAFHSLSTIRALFRLVEERAQVRRDARRYQCPEHLRFLPDDIPYALDVMERRRYLHVSRSEDRSGLRPAYTVLAEQLLAKIGSVRSLRDQQRGRSKGLRGQTPVQLLKSAEAIDKKAALRILPRLIKAVQRRKRHVTEGRFEAIAPAQLFTEDGEAWVARETQSHRAWWSYPRTARAIDAFLVLQQVSDEQARLQLEVNALERWLALAIEDAFAEHSPASNDTQRRLVRIYLRWYRPKLHLLAGPGRKLPRPAVDYIIRHRFSIFDTELFDNPQLHRPMHNAPGSPAHSALPDVSPQATLTSDLMCSLAQSASQTGLQMVAAGLQLLVFALQLLIAGLHLLAAPPHSPYLWAAGAGSQS